MIQEVRYISLNTGAEVGVQDSLLWVRVVKSRRDGSTIYGKTVPSGNDTETPPILFDPDRGDQLRFEPSDIVVTFSHIEALSTPRAHGYRPVAGALWTWIVFAGPVKGAFARYLLAAARRLDLAHQLLVDVTQALQEPTKSLVQERDKIIAVLGRVDLMSVALTRAVEMLCKAPAKFQLPIKVPKELSSIRGALKDLRDAAEHIDERAMGHVRGKPRSEALSAFDREPLLSEGRLTYASHSLKLDPDIVSATLRSRELAISILTAVCGTTRKSKQPIVFGGAAAAT